MLIRLNDFAVKKGLHSVTMLWRQVLENKGISLTESQLFGFGCGLGFSAIENLETHEIVFSGRIQTQQLQKNLEDLLQIRVKHQKIECFAQIKELLIHNLQNNEPLLVYLQADKLPYLENKILTPWGHPVLICGYDDGLQILEVVDKRETFSAQQKFSGKNEFYSLSIADFDQALVSNYGETGFFESFEIENYQKPNASLYQKAVLLNLNSFCEDNGCADQLLVQIMNANNWFDLSKEVFVKNCFNLALAFSAVGDSGGGFFRKIYASFLAEVADALQSFVLIDTADQLFSLADKWDYFAEQLFQISVNDDRQFLKEIIEKMAELVVAEKELLQNVLNLLNESPK